MTATPGSTGHFKWSRDRALPIDWMLNVVTTVFQHFAYGSQRMDELSAQGRTQGREPVVVEFDTKWCARLV